jgi:hypothetical protein
MSDYFAKNGFQNPDDAYNGPFQFAKQTDLHCFDWLAEHPERQKLSNIVMTLSQKATGVPWYETYPITENLGVNSPLDTLLVDIGGGLGHDLIALKNRYPELPGKLIVQDLPVVINDIKDLPAGIEAMGHDFFQPQPVKNAKAYYLRHVLHDWPDKQAALILNSIGGAMSPESILFIDENVMQEMGVPLLSAQTDINMMLAFSSLERTEVQFRELLDCSGFKVVRVWPQSVGTAMLFEAILDTP